MTVFKAPLIVDKSFYSTRRVLQFFSIASAIVIGLISNFWIYSPIIIAIVLLLAIGLYYYQARTYNKMQEMVNGVKVHMDEASIRTLSNNGEIKQELILNSEHHLIVKEEYSLPEQGIRTSLNEMAGDHHKSYIIVDKAGEKEKFEFLIESHYMQVQLQKIIDAWREKGINITAVD